MLCLFSLLRILVIILFSTLLFVDLHKKRQSVRTRPLTDTRKGDCHMTTPHCHSIIPPSLLQLLCTNARYPSALKKVAGSHNSTQRWRKVYQCATQLSSLSPWPSPSASGDQVRSNSSSILPDSRTSESRLITLGTTMVSLHNVFCLFEESWEFRLTCTPVCEMANNILVCFPSE